MDAIVIYWSKGGNTERVALAIQDALRSEGCYVLLRRVEEAAEIDFYTCDLLCIGFPSYSWRPPPPMDQFLNDRFRAYRAEGRVKIGAPRLPGKNALVFCTYSGPHTGLREATPAVLYAGQFLEHLGFAVVGEWCIVGEFHGSLEASTQGRLGDVRGRPNADDIREVTRDTVRLVRGIRGQAERD